MVSIVEKTSGKTVHNSEESIDTYIYPIQLPHISRLKKMQKYTYTIRNMSSNIIIHQQDFQLHGQYE